MLERAAWSGGSGESPATEIFADLPQFLRRYWLTIAACILASLAAAVLFLANATPLYTAHAQLLISSGITPTLREQTADPMMSLDTPQLESQIALIRSVQIARRVAKDLDLANDPEVQAPPPPSLLARLWPQRPPPVTLNEAQRNEIAVGTVMGGLNVNRIGVSYVLAISYTSRFPELAARIANAVANAYVEDQLAARAEAARQGSQWLEVRIDELRRQMNAAALAVQEFKARRDYRIVTRRDKDGDGGNSSSTRESTPPAEPVTLEELETQAHTYRTIYESFLRAHAESVQRQSYPVTSARVLTEATRPWGKSYPRGSFVLVASVMLGGMAGCALALMRHMLDRTVRSPQQIGDEVGLWCLGQTPRYDASASLRGRRWWHGRASRPNLTEVVDAPFSRFSEAVKSVKTAIGLAAKARPIYSLGITSALPSEGKSVLCGNLAALFAISGGRTLLVDCDLRNSTLSRNLAPSARIGLIEALTGDRDFSECVISGKGVKPDLLPIVSARPILNIADVLASENMRLLLERLRAKYDIVLIDLPPLKPVVDGLAISPLLDGVILAVEWGRTPLPTLAEAAQSLRAAEARIIGAVMTKVDAKAGMFDKSSVYYGRPMRVDAPVE